MNPVRQLRRQTNVTQVELAARGCTSQATVAAYEAGTKSPSLRTLTRLVESMGLTLHTTFLPPLTREDRRSLAFHRAISERLRGDPASSLGKAKRHLAKLERLHPHAGRLLHLWSAWLELDASDLIEQMLDPGMLARDMRQVSPFVGVLSPRERMLVIRDFRLEEGV